MRKRIEGLLFVIVITFAMCFSCVWSVMAVQGAVFVPAPSARIEFEEDAVIIADGRGYFNTARKAKIIITDSSKFFDEKAASEGIHISVRDSAEVEISNRNSVEEEIVISEWTHEGDVHTATIVFGADGNYTWEIDYTNLAGKKMKKISTGSSVTPYVFTIDRSAPSGVVTAVSSEGVIKEWDSLGSSVKNGASSKEKITISAAVHDEISDVSVLYYKVNCGSSSKELNVFTREELDSITNWKEFDTMELSKNQSAVIYFKLVDKVGNAAYINTDYLMLDRQSPMIEHLASYVVAEPLNYVNGIYNDDVRISVRAMDPLVGTTSSDIKSVTYKVFNMGVESQTGILAEFSEKNRFSAEWEGEFVVESKYNNSNDVVVKVFAEDYAGNISVEEILLKIDISAPVIEVSYDNYDVKNGSYFSDNREATIVITERNFKAENMKIDITNSDGVIPAVSEWSKRSGSGNLDNTEWAATILYADDGDYTFDISYCDLAGNSVSLPRERFTIDKTAPQVSVSYDNNDEKNGNYYKLPRVATVEIRERNLNIEDIDMQIEILSANNEVTMPKVSSWESKGDTHTVDILYAEDGIYKFDIIIKDKAGNQAEDFLEEIFCIDTTLPLIEIQGILKNSANKGEVCPKIVCKDSNYFKEGISISLTNLKGEKADWTVGVSESEGKINYMYENVPQEKTMDGNYTLKVSMTDKAGNHTAETINFSVNRFGSSYELEKEAQTLNNSYIDEPVDLVIWEKNVDILTKTQVILFKNEKNILLEENKDYQLEWKLDDEGMKQYTYTIFKENFLESGIYEIFISSKDAAGNVSENNLESENAKLRFGVDKVNPNLVITNLEDGEVYKCDCLNVSMAADDNFALDKVDVYLDDYDHVYKTWDAQELAKISEDSGELTFDISGNSVFSRKLKVVCTDEAGNQTIEEISDFYVTTNLWIHLLNNKLLCGAIVLGAVIIVGVICRIVLKKRSNPLSNFAE